MDGPLITLPIDVVKAVLQAETKPQRDVAIEALERAYVVATAGTSDDTDEWADVDPDELPRF